MKFKSSNSPKLVKFKDSNSPKLEVFEMMKERWAFIAVGGSTGSLHTIGHSRWSTREDTDLGQENVLFLEDVKELVEVWTTKVGDGTKTSKQTLARQLLEVALTDILEQIMKRWLIKFSLAMWSIKFPHQHSSSEVKLVKELSDKDVCLHQVLLVRFLHVLDDLCKPLPLFLSTGYPDEEHLYAKREKNNI